jgi:hypothetical protein
VEWDGHDREYHRHLYDCGFRFDQMPTEILKERVRLSHRRAHAHYRVLLCEFALGYRTVEPRHPDDGGSPPFNSRPMDGTP